MGATLAIKADRFFLPGGAVAGGYLSVVDGRFGLWSKEAPTGVEIRDMAGSWIAPGLVDTHIHGFFGHATVDNDAEGINQASEALSRRGTTSWLPTTFTQSTDDLAASCAAIAAADEARGSDFLGARIQGIFLEGPFFTLRHVGAQNPAFLRDPSLADFHLWQERSGGRVVKSALAPERPGSLAYIAALAAEGVVTAIGHTDATFEQSLAAVNAGASCFVHTFNGQRGLHHREPGVVGCALVTPETYAEIICDGRHVVPPVIKALVEAKGWHHVALITDCLGCGGLSDGEYMSGGLPVLMRGGLCYLRQEDGSAGSIAGSVLTLAEGVKNVVDWGIATAEQAIRMATEVPARSARIDSRCGSILPGREADFVVFDRELKLRETYVGGVSAGS